MDGHDASPVPEERPFRRSYSWPILWGPWVTSVIGLVLLVFGMTVNSPVAVRVTALGLGPLTVVAGLLLPRMRGALELSATGFKGTIDSVPGALMLAHTAAEKAIPEGEPNRDQRAWEATEQAVASLAPFLGRVFISHPDRDHVSGLEQLLYRLQRRTDPPDDPPLAAKPS